MIVDAVRYVAALLAHNTTGVNALLASVPRPGSDSTPAAVTIVNEMDGASDALGPADALTHAGGPTLLVTYVGAVSADTDPRTLGASALVQVLVRYAAPQDAAGATFARDGWHTLRAAARALAAPGQAANVAASVSHKVTLWSPSRIAPYAPPPSDAFAPALLVTVPALDAWALGA